MQLAFYAPLKIAGSSGRRGSGDGAGLIASTETRGRGRSDGQQPLRSREARGDGRVSKREPHLTPHIPKSQKTQSPAAPRSWQRGSPITLLTGPDLIGPAVTRPWQSLFACFESIARGKRLTVLGPVLPKPQRPPVTRADVFFI